MDLTLDAVEPQELEDNWAVHQPEDEFVLPRYLSTHDNPCRTLIALPLTHFEQKLGVLVIEFERRIPCTKRAKLEADLFRRALARILWLQDAVVAQQDGTRKALDELKDSVLHSVSSVDPPRLFFAFPLHSDETVIEAIKDVLSLEYSDCIQMVSWDMMNDAGQITDQIVSEISRCRYGVCYLSEITTDDPDNPDAPKFVDNSNVLIEAGMLDVLVHNRLAAAVAWIPVREAENLTVKSPFDLAAERLAVVPRDEEGVFQRSAFEDLLRNRIDAILVG